MPSAITLVVVENEQQETAVLRQLSQPDVSPRAVAPVLDRGGLVERLRSTLAQAGFVVRTATGRDLESLCVNSEDGPPPPRPGVLVVSAGVDPGVRRLTEFLCGTRSLDLGPGVSTAFEKLPEKNRTALVLINSCCIKSTELIALQEELATLGIPSGLGDVYDAIEGRFFVLKSLLVSRVQVRGRWGVMSGAYPPGVWVDAPGCMRRPGAKDDSDTRRWFRSDRDVLLLNGHSNGLDSGIGDLVLCARVGETGPVPPGEAGLFPCYHDSLCFRQPGRGRAPNDPTGLTSVTEANSRLLILTGCNLVALGPTWFNQVKSLVRQAAQSRTLAVMATACEHANSMDLDFLSLALIAEGRSLGDVIMRANEAYAVLQRKATGLPNGVGPFVLFGNPCLRFEGFRVQDVEPRGGRAGRVHIPLAGVELDSEQGAFVRVELSPASGPYARIVGPVPGIWCRGVLTERPGGRLLYLWLGGDEKVAWQEQDVAIEFAADDVWEGKRARAIHFVRNLPFWMTFIEAYRRSSEAARMSVDLYEQFLAAMPKAMLELSTAVMGLEVLPGVVDQHEVRERFHELVDARLAGLGGQMLHCCIEIACRHGTLQSHGWEWHYRSVEGSGSLGQCLCGVGQLWGQRFVGAGHETDRRVQYRCGVCGPVGEDDGRRILRLDSVTKRGRAGEQLECHWRCRAPEAEEVSFVAAPILESWLKDRRMVGDSFSARIAAGEEADGAVRLNIPDDLVPGLYPFALLAVVNGAHCILRRMIEITR